MRRQVHETAEGPVSDFLIVWKAQAGSRCRFCPAEECTFVAADREVGTCVIRRHGEHSSPFSPVS